MNTVPRSSQQCYLTEWVLHAVAGESTFWEDSLDAVGFTIQTICNMISGNKIKQAGCLKKGYGDQSFPTVL